MQSRASLAADGMNSVKPTSVDPNLRFKCLARWDPRAFAASSGTVNKRTPSRLRNQLKHDSRRLGCLSPGYRLKAIRGVQRLSRQYVDEEFRIGLVESHRRFGAVNRFGAGRAVPFSA